MTRISFQKATNMTLALSLASAALLILLMSLNGPDVALATSPIEENPVSTGDALEVITAFNRVRALAAADLDRNGRPDLVLADGNWVRIVANTGVTTPVWSLSTTVGLMSASAVDLATADLDRDGQMDLVAAAADAGGSSQLVLWRNPITTTDRFTATWAVSNTLTSTARITLTTLVVGDLDRDGAPDVVAAGRDGLIRLWHNPLTGTQPFTMTWSSPTLVGIPGEEINQIALVDSDRDGGLDIVAVMSGTSPAVRLWQNPITGTQPFTTAWVVSNSLGALSSAGLSVAVADFDRNGTPDIAVGDAGGSVAAWSNPLTETAGTQPFTTSWAISITLGNGSAPVGTLLSGDLDGDGRPDLVGGTEVSPSKILVYRNPPLPFESTWPTVTVGTWNDITYDLVVADFEPDGDLDIVSGENDVGAGHVIMWPNTLIHRDAAFDGTNTAVGALGRTYETVIGDLDGDGRWDIVTQDGTSVTVWENDGTPFESNWPQHVIDTFVSVQPLELFDIDGDGAPEIIMKSRSSNPPFYLEVWHAIGSPFEASSWDKQVIGYLPEKARAVDVGDINGDGHSEIVVGTGTGVYTPTSDANTIWTWRYDDNPFASTWISAEVSVVTYTVEDLALGDLDNDGQLDIVFGTWHAPAADPMPDVYQLRAARNDGTPFDGGWTLFDLGRDPQWTGLVPYHEYFGANIYSVDLADFDNNGYLDIVTGDGYEGDHQVMVWKNDGTPFDGDQWEPTATGLGPWWETEGIPWLASTVNSVVATDMNNDGLVDVVSGRNRHGSIPYEIVYWENSGIPFGEFVSDTHWIRHNLGAIDQSVTTVATADLDGDGDKDVVSMFPSWDSIEVVHVWENQGGSVGQFVSDTAPAAYLQGTARELMRVAVSHHGKAVDHDVELAEWRLTFKDITGTLLTSAQADALFANLVVYRDANGDSVWQIGDAPVVTVSTPVFTDGVQTFAFTSGDEMAAISATQTVTYFVVATLEVTASEQTPSAFQIVFDPDAASVVKDRVNGATVSINDTRPITVGPVLASGPVDSVSLTADPTSISADGVSTSVLTATVLDTHNQWAADGTVVTFTTSLGTLPTDPYTATISAGEITATLTASISSGTALVTATADSSIATTTVVFLNIPPSAADDSEIVDEDSVDNAIDVLANDNDANNDSLTVSVVGALDQGGTVVNGGTVVTYTPATDYVGIEVFTYTISDGNGGNDTATVTVTVNNVNDAPTANDDSASLVEDSGANAIDVLANDTILPDEGETLTIVAVGQGSDGSVVITGGGSGLTYAPDGDFYGTDSFTYTVNDGNGGNDTATVTVTVSNVNDAPTANDDNVSVEEDSGANAIDVLANDTYLPDPVETLTIVAAGQGSDGSVAITGGGSGLTYAPDGDFYGTDSFTYTISDGNGGSDMATVTVTVNNVNDAPTANDDNVSVDEDSGANAIDVLANDTYLPDPVETLTIVAVGQGSDGSVVITGGGSGLTYAPDGDFYGTDNFTYTINDGNGGSDTATVTVTVNNVNDAPTANDDSVSVDEDSGANAIDVLANDTYLPDEGETLTIVAVGQGSDGSVAITGGGSGLTYAPDGDFYGTDSFTYTISDGNGGNDTATVTVTVNNANDDPDAVDDSDTVVEDSGANAIDVLANDTYLPDPVETLTIVAVGQGSDGSVAITGGGGGLTYAPDGDFYGTDSFTYTISDGNGGNDTATVTVTVNNVNDAPTANDDSASVEEDSGANAVDALANDTILPDEGETLTIVAVGQGSDGSVAITGGGSGLTYAPDGDFYGTDSFTYTISDGNGGSDTATVTVTVNNANDDPDAVDDSDTVEEDSGANAIDVLANDTYLPDPVETLTIVAVGQGSDGSVAITGGGSGLTYAPDGDFYGTDSFTYTISDGNGGNDTATVTVTVNNVNDAPTANDDNVSVDEDSVDNAIDVLANDTILPDEGETLTISAVGMPDQGGMVVNGGAVVTYTPAANFFGTEVFTYTISDGNGGSDTATVTVMVTSVNDPPNAVDDSANTLEDTPRIIVVLGNDSDPDGDTLTVDAVGDPVNGSASTNGTTVTYTPTLHFNGIDVFTYTVSDAGGLTDTALVTVTVGAANNAPNAVDDTTTTFEDTVVTINVLANDTDPDGDTLVVDTVGTPANGNTSVNGIAVTYTPTLNFEGTDSFTYTVSDGDLTDTAAVTVVVTNVNDDPDAVDDSYTVDEDSSDNTLNLLNNDTYLPDPVETLTITVVGAPDQGGSVVNNGTVVTYTPVADFFGTEVFTYTINDGNGGTDTATVTVTVTNVNDSPDAVDDSYTVNEDSSDNTLNLLNNDTYLPDPVETLTIAVVGAPDQGGSVASDGTVVTYTPTTDFFGTEVFTYTISDGNGGTDTATTTVTVTNVNDSPDAVNDTASTNINTPVTVAVLTNDTDRDGDTVLLDSFGVPVHGGSVVRDDNGTPGNQSDDRLVYTPSVGFSGDDAFVYVISDGFLTDTATVTVTVAAGALDHITVNPASVMLGPGGTQAFTARGYDEYDNEVSGLSFAWDVVNGGGVIDSSGVFTAGTVVGVYTDTVQATAGGISGYASVTVTEDRHFILLPLVLRGE